MFQGIVISILGSSLRAHCKLREDCIIILYESIIYPTQEDLRLEILIMVFSGTL